MAEQLSPRHEKHEDFEVAKNAEAHERSPETPRHHEHQPKDVETIKHKVEVEAKSAAETKVDKESSPHHQHLVTAELKQEALKRGLQKARKHLALPDKALSRVIHQPLVDVLSKVGEKTIARPKGIVAGSILALLGSSYLLYSAKYYGYQYNYLVVIILFGGGYILGLIIEMLWFSTHRRAK